jgi:hypothetical protein
MKFYLLRVHVFVIRLVEKATLAEVLMHGVTC